MLRFIADVGSNFNGSKELAKKYVKICKSIGIDIVKFQCWEIDDLFSRFHPAYEVLKRRQSPLGLPLEWHEEIKEEADRKGITFSTTPTQPYHVEKLEEIGVEIYKVASGDLTFFPLLDEIDKTGKPVILSTGMATLSEIKLALDRLLNCREIVLLHCISLYPPEFSEINLKVIETLKREFYGCSIGLSDHTPGYEIPIATVSMGISYIEKHITLSKEIETPDAPFSLSVDEFKKLIETIKKIETSMGDGKKVPVLREIPERFWARRGIYAKELIRKGEVLTFEKFKFLRPCRGVPAENFEALCGKILKRDIYAGEPISFEDV
jgi:sialic acid synthase SpsE